ncbi:MAG: esterase-like activity of phytase family protein [Deltaproteobacteria bacterium]|nr:esterase-like activity of phytase family protein [Deltaproteobacteria bacterium]
MVAPSASGYLPVTVIPIVLDSRNPNASVGSLKFLSGFELKSSDPRFGGFSGLTLSADGTVLYAVSDRGYWASAKMRHDSEARLSGLDSWEMDSLLTPEASTVSGPLTDAEALARDRDDGSLIVGFEQIHRLWRYRPPPAGLRVPPQPVPIPAELQKAPRNGGIEAVTVLLDGRIFILAEEFENPDGRLKGWLIDSQNFSEMSYVHSDRFRPTDMATLPNGDVLVLERRYGFLGNWGARFQRLSRESLRPGARVAAEEIARIEPPLTLDNFEGLAVHKDEKGNLFIYIISDDNYSFFQRTLLLQFRLEAAGD